MTVVCICQFMHIENEEYKLRYNVILYYTCVMNVHV